MTGEISVTRTPDGYDMCPACGHHTSAFCGSCTVILPLFDAQGNVDGGHFCGCDCYKALRGISLLDKIAGWWAPDARP